MWISSRECSTLNTSLQMMAFLLAVLLVQSVAGLTCVPSFYNSRYYTYCTDTRDRGEAQTECSITQGNMRLAVFETQLDFDYWSQWFSSQAPDSEVWIGAKFSSFRNAWWWDEGFPVALTFFSPSPPDTAGVKDGACLTMFSNQYLAELSCSETRGFLCQENYPVVVPTQAHVPEQTTQGITTEITTDGPTEAPRQTIPGDTRYCRCECTANATRSFNTHSEKRSYLKERKSEIKKNLYVDKKVLSANVRRKSSAEDRRESAQSVGYVGVVMLLLTFGSIFLMDLPSLWHNLKDCFAAVRARC